MRVGPSWNSPEFLEREKFERITLRLKLNVDKPPVSAARNLGGTVLPANCRACKDPRLKSRKTPPIWYSGRSEDAALCRIHLKNLRN